VVLSFECFAYAKLSHALVHVSPKHTNALLALSLRMLWSHSLTLFAQEAKALECFTEVKLTNALVVLSF